MKAWKKAIGKDKVQLEPWRNEKNWSLTRTGYSNDHMEVFIDEKV